MTLFFVLSFKNGKICLKVKSQPDVAEPRRYETNPPDEAEEQDKEGHDQKSDAGKAWNQMWAAKKKQDIPKEGKPNPEGAPKKAGLETLGETRVVTEKPQPTTLAQVLAEDDEQDGDWN